MLAGSAAQGEGELAAKYWKWAAASILARK